MYKITDSQRKLLRKVMTDANNRENELSIQISELEDRLEELNREFDRCRKVVCHSVNMINCVEPFDEKLLKL